MKSFQLKLFYFHLAQFQSPSNDCTLNSCYFSIDNFRASFSLPYSHVSSHTTESGEVSQIGQATLVTSLPQTLVAHIDLAVSEMPRFKDKQHWLLPSRQAQTHSAMNLFYIENTSTRSKQHWLLPLEAFPFSACYY